MDGRKNASCIDCKKMCIRDRYEVVLIVLSSFIGMIAISVALEGYLLRHVNPLGRILCAMGGLALLVPGTLTDLAGLIVLVIVAAIQVIENRRDKAAKAA